MDYYFANLPINIYYLYLRSAYSEKTEIYMTDSDQHPDSNRYPLASLSQITVSDLKVFSNQHPLKFSDLWSIYWLGLGHTSVSSLDVDIRK